MSFVDIPSNSSIESLLVFSSKPNFRWVPTLQIAYINENGRVGLTRRGNKTALSTPRGTFGSNCVQEQVGEFLSSVVIRRATGTFGKGNRVRTIDLVLVPKVATIVKPLDAIEKDKWKSADGIVLVPVIVPIKTEFAEPLSGPRESLWEMPETAIEMLNDEVARLGTDAAVSRISADALTTCLPYIYQMPWSQ